jgi:hypothetical protein
MAAHAAHWVDRVLPDVPLRQWVLTVPWPRRLLLARNHKLSKGVHGVLQRLIQGWYRTRAEKLLGVRGGRTGAITVIQRFGSDLRLNLHFHCLLIDGVYVRDPATGKLVFHGLPPPTTKDIEEVVATLAHRAERWLARQGWGADEDIVDEVDDDAQQTMQAASIAGRVTLGKHAGRLVRRYRLHNGRPYKLPPRCASCSGYNLHAGTTVTERNRSGRERLCRYLLRPPLAKSRLTQRDDGDLVIQLSRAWSDGALLHGSR